jgi:hypothetical protein
MASAFEIGKEHVIEWTSRDLTEGRSLHVSNPMVVLPPGIIYRPEFISQEEETELLKEIGDGEFVWEGFDQRRRLQRFSSREEAPFLLQRLAERVEQATGHKAGNCAVEECQIVKTFKAGEYKSNWVLTTFESASLCGHEGEDSCDCFVAQITIGKNAVQHLHRPAKRQANFWDLTTKNHSMDVLMERRSLLEKTDDCLSHWRNRLAASSESDDPVIVVKFYNLPESSGAQEHSDDEAFGYMASKEDPVPRGPMPKLEDLLTIIITTSPIR